MDSEIPKAYEPQKVEDAIYKRWETSGFFNPDQLTAHRSPLAVESWWRRLIQKLLSTIYYLLPTSFTIVMPPPNVTGTLHVGHAVMLALEDIMIRFARMRGKRTLWVPGTDHAAIATQNVVEKNLMKSGIKDPRQTLGREKFLEEVKKFAAASHDRITTQIRKMGASCDWSREAYTLDEPRSLAVRTIFKKMYDDGLIYRGDRIVNWCPRCKSTLADDEVNYREEKTPFYYFKYGPVVIGTARPETKFFDKTLVVHPDDARYQRLVGKEFEVPWIDGTLKSNVIADPVIDPNFGTGAMTITPAHSFDDFELAQRHKFPIVKIIDEDGNFTAVAGEFAGKNARQSRDAIVEILRKKGLVDHIDENYVHNLSLCYRCDTPVEPLVSKQWFVAVDRKPKSGGKSLKERAIEAVQSGAIKIIPERFNKEYFHWMENLHDWCISRQIWFGHRIPVWYCYPCHDNKEKYEKGEYYWLPIEGETPKQCPRCGLDRIHQDNDTLDTWFSSALWTFSTLGWPTNCAGQSVLQTHGALPWLPIVYSIKKPERWALNAGRCKKTGDLASFHPTSVLETGYDILFFWIARMVMMTTYALNEVPFKTVYLHGLVRDEQGRKMSKSLGNVIDPLDMTEKYGADATRLSLVIGTAPGNDVKLSEAKIAGFRNFTNKLWNISRYVLTATSYLPLATSKLEPQTLADRWILGRLGEVTREVTDHLERYEFSPAGELLRDFTWNELADWYLEIAKCQMTKSKCQISTQRILLYILSKLLPLWHPFMPFVTEHIWSLWGERLGRSRDDKHLLMVRSWPSVQYSEDRNVVQQFAAVQGVVTTIRSLRSIYGIEPGKTVAVSISAGKGAAQLVREKGLIAHLARVGNLEIAETVSKPPGSASAVFGSIIIYLDLAGVVDLEKERDRLKKQIDEARTYRDDIVDKISNRAFVSNAPQAVVAAEREKLTVAEGKLKTLEEQLQSLG